MLEKISKSSDDIPAELSKCQEMIVSLTGQLEKHKHETNKTEIEVSSILSEERRLKEILKSERDLSKAILSSITEGLLVIDNRGKVILMNMTAGILLRIAPAEANGKEISKILSIMKDEKELTRKEWPTEKVLKEIDVVTAGLDENLYFKGTKSKPFPVSFTMAPLLGRNGVRGAVIVFHDSTEDKALEDARSNFISVASHQLRAPIVSLRWYAEMLESEDVGKLNDDQKDFVGRIYKAALSMADVITLLLSLARVESGRIKHQFVKTDIAVLTQDIFKRFSPQFKEKSLKAELLLPENKIPEIEVDVSMLDQVLSNLISNAIRYTKKEGKLEVKIEPSESKLGDITFSVKDDGIGIPAKDKEKIFKKFFRAPNAVGMVPDGDGLGLALASSLVGSWGGEIWFDSLEGHGTTFYFTVPMVKSKENG